MIWGFSGRPREEERRRSRLRIGVCGISLEESENKEAVAESRGETTRALVRREGEAEEAAFGTWV